MEIQTIPKIIHQFSHVCDARRAIDLVTGPACGIATAGGTIGARGKSGPIGEGGRTTAAVIITTSPIKTR